MGIDEFRQAVTDALAAVALVQARTTDRNLVRSLYQRYAEALMTEPDHLIGAALVSELARVVGEIQDHG